MQTDHHQAIYGEDDRRDAKSQFKEALLDLLWFVAMIPQTAPHLSEFRLFAHAATVPHLFDFRLFAHAATVPPISIL